MTKQSSVCDYIFVSHVTEDSTRRALQHLEAIMNHLDMIRDVAGIDTLCTSQHDAYVTLELKHGIDVMLRGRDTIRNALDFARDLDAGHCLESL